MAQQDDDRLGVSGFTGAHTTPSTATGQGSDTDPVIEGTEQYMRLQKQKPLGAQRERKPDDIALSGVPRSAGNTAMADALPSQARRGSSPLSGRMSPGQQARGASPGRKLSPATSQIFERDVQESAVVPELSPAIPQHIQTEDHIPAVLEASSLAITDDHLGPDDVEIVTHTAHQPASVAAQSALGESPPTAVPSALHELAVPAEHGEDANSTYGQVDNSDPRRLSFISFADVVHAEHNDAARDPMHAVSPVPFRENRSPSPARSPLVPLSPPAIGSPLSQRVEVSPIRGGAASITSSQGVQHGELSIETMRQALQKTGSHDMSGGAPLSASSEHDGAPPRSFG